MSRSRSKKRKGAAKARQERGDHSRAARPATSAGDTAPAGALPDAIVAGLLVLATFAVFQPVVGHEFVDYDDLIYIVENPILRAGASWQGIASAFATSYEANWIPLTTISFQLEYPFFGVSPTGYHITNVVLHALSAVLLFLAFARMTGARWRSAFVAAVFALHPLHVESVAWAAERKDTLSGLFWMLTLLAYASYASRPRSLARYGLVLACLTLGLLSKPMVVTLPLVLLLLDFWPLARLTNNAPCWRPEPQRLRRALLEKLPMLALVAAFSVVTLMMQRGGGAMEFGDQVAMGGRIENALVSYIAYLRDTIWPSGLAVFYPHPIDGTPLWQAAGAGFLLVAVSLGCLRLTASSPYLLVGWLWYLGTLVPVIGLVQVGLQARADRYVYLPMIGIAIMLAWGLPDLVARVVRDERTRQITLGAAALAALASWAVTARVQVHHWRDTIALFEQATAVTSNNSHAHNLLADALLADDRAEDADLHYAEALRIRPGWAAATLGRSDVKLARGEVNAAIAGFREVLRERPESSRAIGTLGLALMRTGQRDEAQRSLERALELDPGAAIFHVGLGNVASQRGRIREALAHFRDALRLQPSLRPAANNLAWILATAEDVRLRDPQTAIRIARDASLLPGSPDPELLDTLAAAYAAAGRYEEAALVADRAAAIAEARGQSAVGATIRRHAALFRSGRPYVEHQTHATADD